MERKMDVKIKAAESKSLSGVPRLSLPPINDVNPFEVADRFKDTFAYLMELPL
jgi:hypothetical protein